MEALDWIKEEPLSPVKTSSSEPVLSEHNQTIPDEIRDEQLRKAAANALQDGKMLPLIKTELKYTILSRRFAKGMGDIVTKEPEKPKPKRDLTAAEMERKMRRREQNRRAATKCRYKKKDMEDNLLTTFFKEQNKNSELNKQIQNLHQEKLELERLLQEHACVVNMSTPMRDNSYTPPNSATLPTTAFYDPNGGSLSSPSLYGGDVFTFDKPTTEACAASYSCQDPGSVNTWPPHLPDMFTHTNNTPSTTSAETGTEFEWAECFSNISELLNNDDYEFTDMPILNSEDLNNNLAPPGP